METVACIVLNWNGGDRVLACLRSVRASAGVDTRLFVVDNASTDGSPEAIMAEFPGAVLLRNSTNVGLAYARNQALEEILQRGFGLVLLIDDDATLAPATLRQLVDVAMPDSATGIVTPRILDSSDHSRIWYDGGVVNIFGETRHRHLRARVDAVPATPGGKPAEVAFATGCCMLVRRQVFEAVGYLDEDFFVYSEDAEFSFRARRAGFRVLHVPHAIAFHHQSTDTRANRGKWYRDYYEIRNRLLLVRKHASSVPRIVSYMWIMLRHGLTASAYFACTGQFRRVVATGQGIGDFLSGRFGRRFS